MNVLVDSLAFLLLVVVLDVTLDVVLVDWEDERYAAADVLGLGVDQRCRHTNVEKGRI